jgi:hypothetical protein
MLGSVGFDAGIIGPMLYTTLVVTAVLTSQFAGAWLDLLVRKGWPLLAPSATDRSADISRRKSIDGLKESLIELKIPRCSMNSIIPILPCQKGQSLPA